MHIVAFKTLRAQRSSTPFVRHFDLVSSHTENKNTLSSVGLEEWQKTLWLVLILREKEGKVTTTQLLVAYLASGGE